MRHVLPIYWNYNKSIQECTKALPNDLLQHVMPAQMQEHKDGEEGHLQSDFSGTDAEGQFFIGS
jgi:hypothetical protein